MSSDLNILGKALKNIGILVLLFSILLLVSCAGKQLQKTDQKKLFTSNEQVIFDTEKKLFKYIKKIITGIKQILVSNLRKTLFTNSSKISFYFMKFFYYIIN